jgi:rhodanese-related sulfurtransferase
MATTPAIEPTQRKRSPTRRYGVIAAFALLAITVVACALIWAISPVWPMVNQWIALRYSDVEFISTATLAKRLHDEQKNPLSEKILLLDIREANEYALSRIPGAKHVAPSMVIDFAERELTSMDRGQAIVVYCAVGVRSAEAARDLQFVGFTNVRNLRGSIFQWANESRALEGGSRVHQFDAYWGQLLRDTLREPISSP